MNENREYLSVLFLYMYSYILSWNMSFDWLRVFCTKIKNQKIQIEIFFKMSFKNIIPYSTVSEIHLWWFLFWKEDVTLLQSALKNCWPFWEGQNTNIKKGYTCVYHLLSSVARSLLFRLRISSACFYNKKNFFITVNVALIMQCLLKATPLNNEKIKF